MSGDSGYDKHGVLPVENLEHEVSSWCEDEAANTGTANRNAGRKRSPLLEVATHRDDGRQEHESDTET